MVGIIFTLRRLFGWGGHRIAAELKAREIGQVRGKTVYKLFERLGLSVKVYALKGHSDGIACQRHEKDRPNAQWHIDLKHARLSDGSTVYIYVIVDGCSRYALAAVAGRSATTEWVARVAQATRDRCGKPDEGVFRRSGCAGAGGTGDRSQPLTDALQLGRVNAYLSQAALCRNNPPATHCSRLEVQRS